MADDQCLQVTTAVHILADLITMIYRKAIKQEAAECRKEEVKVDINHLLIPRYESYSR